MNRIVVSLFLSIAIVGAASRARADKMQTIPDEEAKVAIDVPEGWGKKAAEHELIMMDPGGNVLVAVKVLEAADVKAALKEADKDLADIVTGDKWEKPAQRDVHGMPGLTVDGTAKLKGNGADVNLMLTIVKAPSGKIVLVGVVAASAKLKEVSGELKAILGSLRPM